MDSYVELKHLRLKLINAEPEIDRIKTIFCGNMLINKMKRKMEAIMFCPNCGTKLSETETYCHHCGKKIDSSKKQRNRFPKGVFVVLAILSIILIGVMLIKSTNINAGDSIKTYIRDENLQEENDTGAFVLDVADMNLPAGNEEDILESLSSVRAIIGVDDPKKELTVKNKTSFDNETYYRFEQSYKGLPIIGKSIIVKSGENGVIDCITCDLAEAVDIDTEPVLNNREAVIELEKQGYKVNESELKLCILFDNLNTPVLVYRMESGFYSIIIDANNGSILQFYNKVNTVKESVQLQGQSTSRNVEIEKSGKQYQLYDSMRNIYVFDSRNVSMNMSQDDACALSPLIVFDEGATNPSRSAVDALYNIQHCYDFWKTDLGRTSTDGNGRAKIEIYDYFTGYISSNNKQEGFTDNAAAGSDTASVLTRVFIGPRSQTGVSTYSDDMEAMAHEYTHAVLKFIVDLSSDEGGAINEGLADIMGELTHASYNNGNCDWKNSLRNMEDPANSPNNKKYASNYKQYDRSVDEHDNSTIISHIAYLIWSAHNAPSEIKPIADYKKMSKLWYQTMLLLRDRPSFKDIRAACEMSAYKMMKKELLDQSEFNCVVWAFDQSGIGYDKGFFEDDTVDIDDLEIVVKDYAGNITTDYMLLIESGDGTTVYSGAGKDVAQQKFDLPEGIYSFYISSPYKGFPDYRKVRKAEKLLSTLGVKNTSRGKPKLFGNRIVFDSIYGTGIYGTVNDDRGKKLNKVLISAKRVENSETNGDTERWEAVSNENGEYHIFMPKGSYIIEGMLEGYQNVEIKADVDKNYSELALIIPANEGEDSHNTYTDYSQIIEKLEKEYGSLEINICKTDNSKAGNDYRKEADGLCYLELLDFNNDGVKELLAVAKHMSDEDYTIYVYTIENDSVKELLTSNSILNNFDDDYRDLYIKTNYDHESFIDGGFSYDGFEYYKIYGMKGNAFGLISASSIIDTYNRVGYDSRKYYYIFDYPPERMDASELLKEPGISREEYETKIDEWICNHQYDYKLISLMYGLTESDVQSGYQREDDKKVLEKSITKTKEEVGIIQNSSKSEGVNNDTWKKSYIDYIETDPDVIYDTDWCTCGLIYLDNDDVPELIIDFGIEAYGTRIVSCKNDELVSYQFSRTGGIKYYEREGLVYNSVGVAGTMFDEFAFLDSEGFHDQGRGYRYDESQMGSNYTYFNWNGEDVSEKEYYKCLDAFDDTRAQSWNSYSDEFKNNNYRPDEMREVLINN